jgi:hypothetical protein
MKRRPTAILMCVVSLTAAASSCSDSDLAGGHAYPVGTVPAPTSTPRPNLYGTQAAAHLSADYAAETAAALQMTAEAYDRAITAEAIQTLEARQQWAFEMTQTAVAKTSIAADAQATATVAAQGTERAIAYTQATATAQAHSTAQAEARQATQTAAVKDGAATATAAWATATARARIDALEGTKLAATAQYIEGIAQKEKSTRAFKTYGPWALLFLGVVGLAFIAWKAVPVIINRWRVIRRRSDEGEPLVLLERGPNGEERIALPLRSFWHLLDSGQTPALPPPELQDRAAARQQFANVVQAAGRTRKRRKPRRPALRPAPPTPTIRVVEPEQIQPWIEDAESKLLAELG